MNCPGKLLFKLNCTQAQSNGKEKGVFLFLKTILVVPQQYKSVSMLYIKQFFNKVFSFV